MMKLAQSTITHMIKACTIAPPGSSRTLPPKTKTGALPKLTGLSQARPCETRAWGEQERHESYFEARRTESLF